MNEIFETLASNNSRLFKVAELEKHINDETFKRVIFLALDPFTQFYIRKIPAYTPTPKAARPHSLEGALNSLSDLSSRKVTGNAAIEHLRVMLSSLTEADAKVIERVIGKDLKCGVSISTVNAVWPNMIHDYPCMLASAFDKKLVDKVKYPAYAQLKLDGMRFNALVKLNDNSPSVEYRSRNGKEIVINDSTFDVPFIRMAEFYKCDMVFDGELLVVDEAGKTCDRQTGNGILNKAVKGTQSKEEGSRVRATIWDAITFEKFQDGIDTEIYKDRFAKLSNCISDLKNRNANVAHLVELVPSMKVDSLEQAQRIFTKYLSEGQEGIILKTQDLIWENKRSKNQIKFKGEEECDLKVVGIQPGTGKYTGMIGAILCESADGILKVDVGSGFKDDDRKKDPSVYLNKIVAVKYNMRIKNKQGEESLFLPVLIEVREDKENADSINDIK